MRCWNGPPGRPDADICNFFSARMQLRAVFCGKVLLNCRKRLDRNAWDAYDEATARESRTQLEARLFISHAGGAAQAAVIPRKRGRRRNADPLEGEGVGRPENIRPTVTVRERTVERYCRIQVFFLYIKTVVALAATAFCTSGRQNCDLTEHKKGGRNP